MKKTLPQPYEEQPPGAFSAAHAHPGRLGVIGRLHGVGAARADQCRLLDLCCGSGEHLIRLAQSFPRSQFVGLDASAPKIETAKKKVRETGLLNIEFKQGEPAEAAAEQEPFDYITAGGLFSRISSQQQKKLLETCARLLAPQGVACVGYQALPGWRMRAVTRDWLRHASRDVAAGAGKVKKARETLAALPRLVADKRSPAGQYFKWEEKQIENCADAWLEREFFGTFHSPCYFHQFMGWAREHGLQYLGDAQFGRRLIRCLPPSIRKEILALTSDETEIEQYGDFAINRMFRKSLLCHRDVQLAEAPEPDHWASLKAGSFLRPRSVKPSLADGVNEIFSEGTTELETGDMFPKAVLVQLGKVHPGDILCGELTGRTAEALKSYGYPDDDATRAQINDTILFLHAQEAIYLAMS